MVEKKKRTRSKVNSAERMMNLVALLTESSVPLTLEDISNKMRGQYSDGGEARRTAFERDKRALRKMGVPITTQTLSGNDAGKTAYGIDRTEYKQIDFDLTKDELLALQTAAAVVQIGTQWGKQAVQWLGGSVDENVASTFAHIDAEDQGKRLPQLSAAATKYQSISFTYRGRLRNVHPYGLVARNGFWYLIAFDPERNSQVTYRVDRIEGEIKEGPADSFVRPADFDIATASQRDPKEFEGASSELAVVRIDRRLAPAVIRELGDDAILAHNADGSIDAEVACGNRSAFRSWLYAMVDRAEVLRPDSVREEIIADLARMSGGAS